MENDILKSEHKLPLMQVPQPTFYAPYSQEIIDQCAAEGLSVTDYFEQPKTPAQLETIVRGYFANYLVNIDIDCGDDFVALTGIYKGIEYKTSFFIAPFHNPASLISTKNYIISEYNKSQQSNKI